MRSRGYGFVLSLAETRTEGLMLLTRLVVTKERSKRQVICEEGVLRCGRVALI